MKCPKCGGENCHFISRSHTHIKSFDACDACCGVILMGPIGMLCGLCGAESKSTTKEYWICNDCGSKFSPREAEKFMKEESNKIKKFLFYSEIQAQSVYGQYKDEFGEKVKEGAEKYLIEILPAEKIFFCNPPFENQGMESIKIRSSEVLTEKDLVYLVISLDYGIVIAEKVLIFANTSYKGIGTFRCFGNCVYLNQTCLRLRSEQEAIRIYQFLDFVYNRGKRKTPKKYNSYLEFLETLQALPRENSEKLDHYSSQPEYEEFVKKAKEECMRQFAISMPERYREFEKAKDKYGKFKKLGLIVMIPVAIIVLFWFSTGETLGIIIGIIIFCIAAMILGFIEESKKERMEKLLPELLLRIINEDEKDSLKKEGYISPKEYEDYISQSGLDKGGGKYCMFCGKKLSQEWRICPYCAKEQE